MTLGRWALDTGCLDPAAASQTRIRVAIGASQAAGPREALAELGHLDANPARIDPIDVDGLAWRGMFRQIVMRFQTGLGCYAESTRSSPGSGIVKASRIESRFIPRSGHGL
jgi:hypothetical protein